MRVRSAYRLRLAQGRGAGRPRDRTRITRTCRSHTAGMTSSSSVADRSAALAYWPFARAAHTAAPPRLIAPEHGEPPSLSHLGPLEVDRHRRRTRAVSRRGGELREAVENVAGVAEHRAATGTVAEEGQPGRVLSWSGRLRSSRGRPAPLLRPHLSAKQPAADVAPDESVQIRRRRDDPSGSPHPARRDDLAHVLGRSVGLQVVPVDEGRRELGTGRQARPAKAERLQYPAFRSTSSYDVLVAASTIKPTAMLSEFEYRYWVPGVKVSGSSATNASSAAGGGATASDPAAASLHASLSAKSGRPLVLPRSWRSVTACQADG